MLFFMLFFENTFFVNIGIPSQPCATILVMLK